MYDKELIQKICSLNVTFDDVNINQTKVKYDSDHPFEKYYDVNIIIGAINKYTSKEWTDLTFACWCCLYDWVLYGGYKPKVHDHFSPLKRFIIDTFTWHLDGLSFFNEDNYSEDELNQETFNNWISFYKNFDFVLQTIDEWIGYYSPIGECDLPNGHQYVVLVNEKRKMYMIVFSEFLYNNYKHQSNDLKFISRNKFIRMVDYLKGNNYSIIGCSEEFYYKDLYGYEDDE